MSLLKLTLVTNPIIKDHRGFALIITFIFLVSLTVIASAYLFMVTYETRSVNTKVNSASAICLADAGLHKAVWYLTNTAPDSSTDGSWRTTAYPAAPGPDPTDPQQESLGGGTYTMWVETSGSDILVTARGTVSGVERIIRETITLVTSVPAAFNYAQYAAGDIDFNLSSGAVTGDLETVGTVDNESGMTITGAITEGSSVASPILDTASYAAIADTTVSGNKTFTAGTYSGIWYVDGRVTINDNVTFNGTIIATGNIVLTNTDNFSSTPTDNYPAMATDGIITGSRMGSGTINGLVFAAGNVTLSRATNNTINGSVIAGGDIDMTRGSGWAITYDSDLASDPPPYITLSGGVTGDNWKEL